MKHTISIESVGVLGLSSPINTVIIRLAVKGTPFKINQINAQLCSSLDVSYKTYDQQYGTCLNHAQARQLYQVSNKHEIENMVDEYLQTILLVDNNGYAVRKNISKSNISIPGFDNLDSLKRKIVADLNSEYTKFIDQNYLN